MGVNPSPSTTPIPSRHCPPTSQTVIVCPMPASQTYPHTGPRVVVIGGGTGTPVALRGLKRRAGQISAVVTMFDSGGSSGLLQKEFGYPPLGDLRQCLLGLSDGDESTRLLRELVGFRFDAQSSLNGHSLGNLLLAALHTLGSDLERAVDDLAGMLRITGQVIPVSLEKADLCAELADGQLLRGESTIDLRGRTHPPIERVFLDPPVNANPRAVQAILDADAVVLGPGDLYTSIIPNLLAHGINDALAETQAARIYVCNLMTKRGETDGFKLSDFLREMNRYLGGQMVDWALVNSGDIPAPVRQVYAKEGAHPVEADLEKARRYARQIVATPLDNGQTPLQHQPCRLAQEILTIAKAVTVAAGQGGLNGCPDCSDWLETGPPALLAQDAETD